MSTSKHLVFVYGEHKKGQPMEYVPVRADEGEGPVDITWAYFLTDFAAVLDREWPTQFEPIYEWPE